MGNDPTPGNDLTIVVYYEVPSQFFMMSFSYSGLAILNDTIIDKVRFLSAITLNKISVHAREAPTGAVLTVDILQDQVAQSRTATLAVSTKDQVTDITDINFSTSQDFGLRITGIGSTAPGNDLTVVIHGEYQ